MWAVLCIKNNQLFQSNYFQNQEVALTWATKCARDNGAKESLHLIRQEIDQNGQYLPVNGLWSVAISEVKEVAIKHYNEDCVCPKCKTEIPNDAKIGDLCSGIGCNHRFNLIN